MSFLKVTGGLKIHLPSHHPTPHRVLPQPQHSKLILEMSPRAWQAICCLLVWNLTLGVCESIKSFPYYD